MKNHKAANSFLVHNQTTDMHVLNLKMYDTDQNIGTTYASAQKKDS